MGAINLDLVLSKLTHLPTLPTVAHRVGELVNDPDSGSADIATVMKQDQSLTARVLALVNSAYYSVPGGVSDVARAISYLGFNTIYQLVLTISVFDALPVVEGSKFNVAQLWKHSLGCAIASESIARHLSHRAPEELFTAGMLHDVGKVVLASLFRETLEGVVRGAAEGGKTFREVEFELGLPGHDEIGRRLAEKWRLPATLAAGIGFHHATEPGSRVRLPRHLHAVADMIALGDVLCRRSGIGNAGDEVVPEPDRALLERLNLTDLSLQKVQDDIPRTIERSRPFLDLLS